MSRAHAFAAAALMLPLAAAVAAAQDLEPIAWSLVVVGSQSVQRGDRVTAKVTAVIQPGWHLYATEEIRGGPSPTRLSVPGPAFELAGIIASPMPKSEYDPNFDRQVEFYDEMVTFTLPLRLKTAPPAGPARPQVQVRYQACNERLCLAPRTLTVSPPPAARK